jgi:hypothetical protein
MMAGSSSAKEPRMVVRIELPMMKRMITLLLLTGTLLSLPACNTLGLGHSPDQDRIEQLSKLVYPKDSERGQDLDILVIRKGASLTFVNRTPRVYNNVEIWLNQQYVQTVSRIDIGQTSQNSDYNLASFFNRHAEPYPIGSFLTPEKNMQLLVAELFDPATGLRHHLLVHNR